MQLVNKTVQPFLKPVPHELEKFPRVELVGWVLGDRSSGGLGKSPNDEDARRGVHRAVDHQSERWLKVVAQLLCINPHNEVDILCTAVGVKSLVREALDLVQREIPLHTLHVDHVARDHDAGSLVVILHAVSAKPGFGFVEVISTQFAMQRVLQHAITEVRIIAGEGLLHVHPELLRLHPPKTIVDLLFIGSQALHRVVETCRDVALRTPVPRTRVDPVTPQGRHGRHQIPATELTLEGGSEVTTHESTALFACLECCLYGLPFLLRLNLAQRRVDAFLVRTEPLHGAIQFLRRVLRCSWLTSGACRTTCPSSRPLCGLREGSQRRCASQRRSVAHDAAHSAQFNFTTCVESACGYL
mmetsp:Transcript_9892/g.27594  ORF Transcript_9892/g.27594 Transcript_9892/m.27594 type:complete len:357 (+) Transcript_9892:1282-2352(+)